MLLLPPLLASTILTSLSQFLPAIRVRLGLLPRTAERRLHNVSPLGQQRVSVPDRERRLWLGHSSLRGLHGSARAGRSQGPGSFPCVPVLPHGELDDPGAVTRCGRPPDDATAGIHRETAAAKSKAISVRPEPCGGLNNP